MAAINTLRENMLAMSRSGIPWQAIGDHYGVNKGLAWKVVYTTYEPKAQHLRKLLGLPLYTPCTPINGSNIPEGTQVYTARYCINDKCGHKSFSPNTSRRYQCFDCQKVRKRRQ